MNLKKVSLYILLSFGISWSVALIMKLVNIDYESTLSTIIIGGLYMPGPAIATLIVQKFIYHENFKKYGWSFDQKAIKWLLFTPLIFIALFLLIFGVIGLLGNTHLIPQFGLLDFSQDGFNFRLQELAGDRMAMEEIEQFEISPWMILLIAIGGGIVAGATVNLPFMFGEEFGWRGLMLKETQKLGFLKASCFIGVIWGLWHLPVIIMGHNYPNHPYLGIIMMCILTIALSPIFAYVRLKTKSILGPCMLHGMVNATGAVFVLYIANANELYGSPAGWAGIIAASILTICIFLFDKKFVLNYQTAE